MIKREQTANDFGHDDRYCILSDALDHDRLAYTWLVETFRTDEGDRSAVLIVNEITVDYVYDRFGSSGDIGPERERLHDASFFGCVENVP